jgi:hypothetical protein
MAILAERVGSVYETYYLPGEYTLVSGRTPDDREPPIGQEGDPPDEILIDMIGAEPTMVEDLLEVLRQLRETAVADGGEPLFELDWNYVFLEPAASVEGETWEAFSTRARHQQRFFDPSSTDSLARILGTR